MKKPVNQDEVAALRLQNLPTTEQELALKASGLIVRQKKAMLEVPGEAAFHPGMRSPDSETQVSLQPMSAEAARSARTMVSHMEAGFSREVELLRQFKADSMAVVIRPDDRTQISLRLTMHDGHVNIFARCEEGDFNRLAGHWVELQRHLDTQGVRLMPLSSATDFNQGNAHQEPRQPDNPRSDSSAANDVSSANQPLKTRAGHARSLRSSNHLLETWA